MEKNQKIKYRVYPTLLNKFRDYKNGKCEAEDVLDMVNHTEKPRNKWMIFGLAFHKFTAEPWPEAPVENGFYLYEGQRFPKDFTDEIREMRKGGRHEVYNEREFDTGNNKVMLFCIADTLKDGIIYDLKWTGFYRGLTYLQSWQHRLSLFVIPNIMFRYLITDFKGIYYEDYNQNFSKALARIIDELVEFLEKNEDKITYEKIFQKYYERTTHGSKTGTGKRKNVGTGKKRSTRRRSNKQIPIGRRSKKT